jgi:hypothetical protein
MRKISYPLIVLVVLALNITAGCTSITTPENSISPGTSSIITETPTRSYVSEATLFVTPTTERLRPLTTEATLPPENIVCLVYDKKQTYNNNQDAITFNLVNPPMYLNFTIFETKNGVEDRYVFYRITLRDKNSGVIYKQIEVKKVEYSEYGTFTNNLDKHSEIIKILSVRNLQIEKGGNGVAINTEMWVKPSGNIEGSFDMKSNRCINWPVTKWTEL